MAQLATLHSIVLKMNASSNSSVPLSILESVIPGYEAIQRFNIDSAFLIEILGTVWVLCIAFGYLWNACAFVGKICMVSIEVGPNDDINSQLTE